MLYAADVLKKKDTKQVYCAQSISPTEFNLDRDIAEDMEEHDEVSPYDEVLRSDIIKYQYMI